MLQWLFSRFYDNIMKDAEEKGLRDWRKTLLQNLSGEVLEIGCGTGANLPFYSNSITRLVLVEPNIYMQEKLREKLAGFKLKKLEILSDEAESLSLADNSFDVVVCTLVLCSVVNLEKSLSEIYRILRPQGKFIFIEHVAATNNEKRYRWQRRLECIWKRFAGGCHLTRRTGDAMIKAGFNIVEINQQSMRGVPPIVRPSIRGIAIKTGGVA